MFFRSVSLSLCQCEDVMCAPSKLAFSLNLGTSICLLVAGLQVHRNEQKFNLPWLGAVQWRCGEEEEEDKLWDEEISWFLYLLFAVLVRRSPEHRVAPVWGTTAPADTSSICGFSTWKKSGQRGSINATTVFKSQQQGYRPVNKQRDGALHARNSSLQELTGLLDGLYLLYKLRN